MTTVMRNVAQTHPTARETLVLENRLEELSRMERWLGDLSREWQLSDRVAFAIDLVMNEAVTNLISYAYSDDQTHEIVLTLTNGEEAVVVEIFDDARPFNPFEAPVRPRTPDLESAPIGGLGLSLIKSYGDDHEYGRVADRNRLSLVVHKGRGD
jgi:anti-sigma regulatory factor (Ser/Thr protein kinase)